MILIQLVLPHKSGRMNQVASTGICYVSSENLPHIFCTEVRYTYGECLCRVIGKRPKQHLYIQYTDYKIEQPLERDRTKGI